MELQDKVAVVTGAGRGIGRAIGLGLAKAGAHITVSDIDTSTLGETAAAVKALGRETLAVPADIGNRQQFQQVMVSGLVLDQEHHRRRCDVVDVRETASSAVTGFFRRLQGDRELATDDRLHAGLGGGGGELEGTEQVIGIGDSNCRHALIAA